MLWRRARSRLRSPGYTTSGDVTRAAPSGGLKGRITSDAMAECAEIGAIMEVGPGKREFTRSIEVTMYKQVVKPLNRRNQNLSRHLLDRRGHRRNHRDQRRCVRGQSGDVILPCRSCRKNPTRAECGRSLCDINRRTPLRLISLSVAYRIGCGLRQTLELVLLREL